MAFNLDDYETVESRIKRFYEDHKDGRLITENLTTEADRAKGLWVTRSFVYLTSEDQEKQLPKATGLAFEIDGVGMAQKFAALETCETSSLGRALANANYSGDKRTSREEMEKVQRGNAPGQVVPEGMLDKIANAKDELELKVFWDQATADGYADAVKALVFERKATLKKAGKK
jgi:hypothetical protein